VIFSGHSTEKFFKKLFGESKIESVLQRLAQLTDEEARMAAALSLRDVNDVKSDMKVVMDGTQRLHGYMLDILNCTPVRRQDIDTRHSTDSR
jgi:hypothetical protein